MEFQFINPWVFGYGCGLFVLAAYAYGVGFSDGLERAERDLSEDIGEDVPPRRWWRR